MREKTKETASMLAIALVAAVVAVAFAVGWWVVSGLGTSWVVVIGTMALGWGAVAWAVVAAALMMAAVGRKGS
jgi:F0F1-type ATP synthase assembly protein I